jgi:hypothetical protein
MTPYDQRHVDRARDGQALIIQALLPVNNNAPGGAIGLADLAWYLTDHGLPANSNDTQAWAAMLRTEGYIQADTRVGAVRYYLTPEDTP